ncbi:MAG: Peptide-methionine (S)-S-oxide reductase [Chaenotheca gracillima]|nr:MAG: Peptide-methionine (S)-S-oxide reductase [Chaenotheca gracillima]
MSASIPKPPAGHFTLLYFATAASYTSKEFEHFQASLPISKLFETLEAKYQGITEKVLSSCAVTVNFEYVDIERPDGDAEGWVETVINAGDEVAIIPPVSSG